MDVFLLRIRKYSQTLPDSILPPPEATNANTGPPRMSTPQNDSSWTGWAISSFTNKLASASGEIETDSSSAIKNQGRPASVPPTIGGNNASAGSVWPVPAPQQSGPSVPRVSSGLRNTAQVPDVDNEDFDGGWGDMDDDAADAWDVDNADAKTPGVSQANAAAFDDQGEPDFEGWLNAQAKAKTMTKKPLPKGLVKAKSAMAVPSTASTAKTTVPSRPAPTTRTTGTKRTENKQAEPAKTAAEDDDWGDAWD